MVVAAIDVSIVIPAYNAEGSIAAAIASAVAAAAPYSYEIIVVNDQSTDSTGAVLQRLSPSTPALVVYDNQHSKGPSGARNTGLDYAKGTYIAFLDADDIWLPPHLQLGVQRLETTIEIDAILFDQDVVEQSNNKKITTWMTEKHIFKTLSQNPLDETSYLIEDDVAQASLDESFIHLQAMLIRSSVARSVRFDEAVFRAEDMDYAIQLARKGAKFAYSTLVTGIYYRSENSLTSRSLDNYIGTACDEIRLLEKYLGTVEYYGFDPSTLVKKKCQKQLSLSYGYRKKKDYSQAIRYWYKSLAAGVSVRHCTELLKIIGAYLTRR